MRSLAIVLGTITSLSIAHAAPPTAEVRALVDWATTHGDSADLDSVLVPHGIVVGPRGAVSETLAKRFDPLFAVPDRPTVELAVATLDVAGGEADRSAYFHGTINVTVDGVKQEPMRVTGIAQRIGAAWKLAAIMFTSPLPDSMAHQFQAPKGTPPLYGEPAKATAFGEWLTHKQIAAKRDPHAIAISGTQPGELKTGGAIAAMAAAFDRLDLRPTAIEAHTYGDLTFAFAGVVMAIPRSPNFEVMAAGAVIANDRWLTLDFTQTQGNFDGEYPQPHDVPVTTATPSDQDPFKDLAAVCARYKCSNKHGPDAALEAPGGAFLAASKLWTITALPYGGAQDDCYLAITTAKGISIAGMLDCTTKLDEVAVRGNLLFASSRDIADDAALPVEATIVCGMNAQNNVSCTDAIPFVNATVTTGARRGSVSITVTPDGVLDIEGNPRLLRKGPQVGLDGYDWVTPLLVYRGKHNITFK